MEVNSVVKVTEAPLHFDTKSEVTAANMQEAPLHFDAKSAVTAANLQERQGFHDCIAMPGDAGPGKVLQKGVHQHPAGFLIHLECAALRYLAHELEEQALQLADMSTADRLQNEQEQADEVSASLVDLLRILDITWPSCMVKFSCRLAPLVPSLARGWSVLILPNCPQSTSFT